MEEIVLNSGDTAWVLASTALVLLMTPGLAFFYGGMVRAKSVLNMMMMSMVTIGIVSVLWVIYGFELAFGYKADSAWYGNFSLSGLGSVVNDFTNNGGIYPIPVLVFAAFQLMFAIITPALISGAIADRTKFTAWAIFVAIWSTIVYFPVAHWVFALEIKSATPLLELVSLLVRVWKTSLVELRFTLTQELQVWHLQSFSESASVGAKKRCVHTHYLW